MNLEKIFSKDLETICSDIGTKCVLKGKKVSTVVRAVISDEQSANAGFTLIDGRTINATAQFNAGRLRDLICIGDSFIVEGIPYRVTNITRTNGDSSVTLSLTVEAKR
jgi:hypothetical protein